MRKNLKVALINVAELPDGFLKICHELSDKVEILDEIFGPRCVKALHELLPKINQYGDQAPEIRGSDIEMSLDNYRKYLKALAFIFEKYKEEAAQVAMDETINFSEKIAPFINPDLQLQKEAFICLQETIIDRYNCHILHKFLLNYGDQPLTTTMGGERVTTIQAEI